MLKGQKTQKAVGPMFGVTPETIGKIWRGQTWTNGKRNVGGFTSESGRRANAARRLQS
jgi:hypothetical protein